MKAIRFTLLSLILLLSTAFSGHLHAQSVDFRNLEFLMGNYELTATSSPGVEFPELENARQLEVSHNPKNLILVFRDESGKKTGTLRLRIDDEKKTAGFDGKKWDIFELTAEKGESYFEINMQREDVKIEIWADEAEFNLLYTPWEGEGKEGKALFKRATNGK